MLCICRHTSIHFEINIFLNINYPFHIDYMYVSFKDWKDTLNNNNWKTIQNREEEVYELVFKDERERRKVIKL